MAMLAPALGGQGVPSPGGLLLLCQQGLLGPLPFLFADDRW